MNTNAIALNGEVMIKIEKILSNLGEERLFFILKQIFNMLWRGKMASLDILLVEIKSSNRISADIQFIITIT